MHRVEILKSAKRDLGKLPRDVQVRLAAKIDALGANPRPDGVRKLTDADNLYRVRDGDYRIIYQIQDDALVVVIVAVGDRKAIYRRFG